MKSTPTIITAAVTGAVTSKEQTPYLPVTPEEIATASLESLEAGASIIHIHVRDPDSAKPSMRVDLYESVVDQIKKHRPDAVINLTTGVGSTGPVNSIIDHDGTGPDFKTFFKLAQERVAHIVKIKPDICSLDFNTMNRGPERITINSIDTVKRMLDAIKTTPTKPELELFDSGDVHIALDLMKKGLLPSDPLWQICLGVKWGWEASPQSLIYAQGLLPRDSTWSSFGIGPWEMPIVAQSWIMGGHVRVGLEDNIYIEKGVLAKSNAELVTRAVDIVKNLGGRIASTTEARNILKLPV